MGIIARYKQRYTTAKRFISATLLLISAVAFFSTNQYAALKLIFKWWDPLAIAEYRMQQLTTEDFIREIETSLAEGDIDEAQELVAFAEEYQHKLPKELVDRSEESFIAKFGRYGLDFTKGAIFGEATSVPSLAGSIVSDFFVIGDVRDLGIEGWKFVNGKNYDRITLGLSLIGVMTTSVSVSGLDTGISFVKTAYKSGKISKPLLKKITGTTAKILDIPALKDFFDRFGFKSFGKEARNHLWTILSKNKQALEEMTELAIETGSVAAFGGSTTVMRALSYADNTKDIKKIGIITQKFGKKAGLALKMLGKSLYKLGKLIYKLIFLVLAVLIWLCNALWFFLAFLRKVVVFSRR